MDVRSNGSPNKGQDLYIITNSNTHMNVMGCLTGYHQNFQQYVLLYNATNQTSLFSLENVRFYITECICFECHVPYFFGYKTDFFLPKQSQRSKSILQDESRSLGLFRKGKIGIIAKFHRTDLVN